jgi:cell division transport system permease protein
VRALAYFVDEAFRSLWRGRLASLLAVTTSGVSLLVLGLFLLLGSNASRILERWSAAAEFSVYLADTASAEDRAAIERTLATSGVVAEETFVTPAQALDVFSRQFPDLASAARSLPSNPLPASYEVRLRPELGHAEAADRLAARLRTLAGVSDVRYDRRWIDRLLGLVQAVRATGLALASLLIMAAVVTIMSVVRLTLVARRQEIEIMQLVGAPLSYIRGPFVMEGTLQGLAGAALALLVLGAIFAASRGPLVAWASGLVDAGDLTFLPASLVAAVLGGGTLVGCVGGALASRAAR